jgi:hypothetical protein
MRDEVEEMENWEDKEDNPEDHGGTKENRR